MDLHLLPALLTTLLSSVLILALAPVARTLRLLDIPGGHKRHERETPLVGGLAIYISTVVMLLTMGFTQEPVHYSLLPLTVGLLMVGVGAIDDRFHLGVTHRFVVQILAGLIMALGGGVYIQNLGPLVSPMTLEMGLLAIPFSVFAVVGGVNAMNMADGLDGLAGSLALVTLLALAAVAYVAADHNAFTVLAILIGACIGFLFFNARIFGRRHASVFMGDAGSMLLGLMITWFLISLSQGERTAMHPVTALWLFGFPLIDTVSIMLRRIIRRRSPFAPDHGHLHHILQRAGYSVNTTVLLIIGLHSLMAAMGLFALYAGIPDYVMFYSFMIAFSLHFWGTMHAWRLMKQVRAFHEEDYLNV